MTEKAQERTLEQMHANFLRDALERRAADLRSIAERFDRLAAQVDNLPPAVAAQPYSSLAQSAMHDLMWGIANLCMERVINEAANADVARAVGQYDDREGAA